MNMLIRNFAANESGATAIEYGLIAALISVVVIGTLTSLGTDLKAKFSKIDTAIKNAS